MKTKTSINALLLAIAIGFTSLLILGGCKKLFPPPQDVPTNTSSVTASICGIITDENGASLSNVVVRTGVHQTLTDANGFFKFYNIPTSKRTTCVIASKDGYFNGSKTFMVKQNQNHTIKIMMMNHGVAQTFNTTTGGAVSFSGIKILFAPNSIVRAGDNSAYTGQVHVYTKYIDPTTELGLNTMPGDLRGLSANEERLLISFAMAATELKDGNGNSLQLKSGSEAQITFDIPSSIVAQAKPTIPLWYFDETSGLWKEEGSATLVNGHYEGKVKHFSFWNCDYPQPLVDFELTLYDINNNPLHDYWVKLTDQSTGDVKYKSTNSSGWVGGSVPKNTNLTLEILKTYPAICGGSTILKTQTINASNSNINLGVIQVALPNNISTTIEGNLVGCNGTPLTNSIVIINPGNILVPCNSLGHFTNGLPCTPSVPVTIAGFDLTSNAASTLTNTLSSGVNNVGNITVCGGTAQSQHFVHITLTDNATSVSQNINFEYPTAALGLSIDDTSVTNASFSILTAASSATKYMSIICQDTLVGSHVGFDNSIGWSPSIFADTTFREGPMPSTLIFTQYDPFPGSVKGSFSMALKGNQTNATYTATGTFCVPRLQ